MNHHALGLRKACPEQQVARRFFFHREVHVHLIVGARNRRGLHVDFVEKRQSFQPGLGTLDGAGGNPGALGLAHLSSQHFVLGLGVALEVYPPHVNPFSRIDEKRERNGLVFLIDLRNRVYVGEGVAFGAEPVGELLAGLGNEIAREHISLANLYQIKQLFRLDDEISGELDLADGE